MISHRSCKAHFDNLAAEHGLRHPIAETSEDGVDSYDEQPLRFDSYEAVEASGCEALLLLHNGSLYVKLHHQLRHPIKLAILALLVSLLPPESSFVAGLSTSELAICDTHKRGQRQTGTLADGMLPADVAPAQLHLMFTVGTVLKPLARGRALGNRTLVRPGAWQSKRCVWRGSQNGDPAWQAAHHRGRTRCARDQTDRKCLELMGAQSSMLDVSFKWQRSLAFGNDRPHCILAVDGWGQSSLLAETLQQGSMALRVGGINVGVQPNKAWGSEYAWFEPLLVDRRHYVRSTIDQLESTLREVDALGATRRAAIAAAGRAASRALFTSKSMACYALLKVGDYSAAQPNVRRVAAERLAAGEFRPVCQVLRSIQPDAHLQRLGLAPFCGKRALPANHHSRDVQHLDLAAWHWMIRHNQAELQKFSARSKRKKAKSSGKATG